MHSARLVLVKGADQMTGAGVLE